MYYEMDDVNSDTNEPPASLEVAEHDRDDGQDSRLRCDFKGLLSGLRRRPGLFWIAVTIVTQAGQLILFAKTSSVLTLPQATFVRGLSLIPMVFFISWEKSKGYGWAEMAIFISAGFCDNLTYVCGGAAAMYVWTGDVAVIQFNTPLPGVLLAWLLFKEKLRPIDLVLILVNACGLVIVSQPSFLFPVDKPVVTSDSHHALGILLAFGGMTFSLTATLCARALPYRNAEDPYLFLTCTGIFGLFLSCAISFISEPWTLPATLNQWLMVLALIFFVIVGLFSYIKSLETESVMTVTVLVTLSMLLTTIFDFIFEGRHADFLSLCGVAVILGSTFSLFLKDLVFNDSEEEAED